VADTLTGPPAAGQDDGRTATAPRRTERRVTPTAIRRRRRRLLWWSLPVVLLALATSLKLASLSLTAQDAIDAAETARFDESISASDSLMTFNWFEPWIAYYDRGTVSALAQEYNDATDDLSVALELAPDDRSCDVRVNLALAWEELGDIYAEGGYLRGASLLYDTALAVIRGGEEDGCFRGEEEDESTPPEEPSDGSTDAGERLENARDRVEGKQDAVERQEGEQGQGAPGTDAGDGGSPTEDLEDRGDAAEQERRDQDADQRGGGEYVEKPW
jgi:tetratricopeptide (TPR) repeat protein